MYIGVEVGRGMFFFYRVESIFIEQDYVQWLKYIC